jgi:hypothetical protein
LVDRIATISTNEDWDLAFGEALMLAKGVEIDSIKKGDYLNSLSTDLDTLKSDNKKRGSLMYFAAHINGASYQLRVVPMMKALMCGVAAAAGAPAVARAPRAPDVLVV